MMTDDPAALIPHRPPFLLLEKILHADAAGLKASARARSDDELWSRVFAGHYPGQPIVPGVLLCEMAFQAAAAWMASRSGGSGPGGGVPVVARIQGAKFKKMVAPDEALEVSVSLVEEVGGAYFMKGSIKSGGALAASVEFSVALA